MTKPKLIETVSRAALAIDWANIARRVAVELLGTPEGAVKLAEARRYEMLAAEITRLTNAVKYYEENYEPKSKFVQLPESQS